MERVDERLAILEIEVERSLGDGGLDATQPANGIDGPQVVLVPFLRRQPALQRYPQAGAVQGGLDVMRGQRVAGEQHVQEAVADQPVVHA